MNSLYAKHIKKLDEIEYNYDTRFYKYFRFLSKGKINMDYVMRNTAILHFVERKNRGTITTVVSSTPFTSITRSSLSKAVKAFFFSSGAYASELYRFVY